MHKLLQRQMQRHLTRETAGQLSAEWRNLLGAVSEAYEQAEQDRALMERSLEITSQELLQRNQDLARSNTELQQFAYVASHDLQEPLRMVASFIQLLAKRYQGRLDAQADEFIAYASDGATRMQRLINDLLAYSRLETRRRPYEPTPIADMLELSLMNLRVAIAESEAVVSHDPLPTVMADQDQLTQLFQNLVGNAIKFHGPEAPRIHVSAEASAHAWTLAVRDNGIGLESQYAQRIFVIFQRLHTAAQYPGPGIGLAICKKIVERHGGRIWVESTPGAGACFKFTMPRAQELEASS